MKTSAYFVKVLLIAVITVLVLSGCEGSMGQVGPTGPVGPVGPTGPAGVSVTGVSVNNTGHLILTLSNGQMIDAGSVIGPQVTPVVPSSGTTMTMVDLFSLVQPVICRVEISKGSGFIDKYGSGVIIRDDGYIITNEHVIRDAKSILVTLNNDQHYSATVTSSDADVDLAIIKITNSPTNLRAAVLGSSSDITVGGVVVAAGFPLGSALPGPASFTQGVVSAIRILGGHRYIQSDVQIHPGSSGGALVTRGSAKVIGLISYGVFTEGDPSPTGIGMAIPIDVVQAYLQNNLK